ncbi:hypothetical protein ID866_8157 [Astraeus odoratus]|nr:hypothetical protein ID866_8157 [Astraeus odoratus]
MTTTSTAEVQVQQQDGVAPTPCASSISTIRATKRKLEDAMQSLDAAVSPSSLSSSSTETAPISKRPHLSRSLYSTLAKYGIKSREDSKRPQPPDTSSAIDLSKNAPHLAAILARTSSRVSQSPKTVPFKLPSAPPKHMASEYRPSSTQSLLSRLATYKLSTYANKPSQIDAVAAAKCGWINDGKDRLVCGICNVSWVLAAREGMNREAASVLVEKQRVSLVEMHKDGCPWKTRQCDASIYRVPMKSPSTTASDLRTAAIALEDIVSNVAIKHPLTPSQLDSLRTAVSVTRSPSPSPVPEDSLAMQVDECTPPPRELSDTSLTTALFGWVPAPPLPPDERRRTSSFSSSRLGSFGPSASMPPTPSLSRASSVSRLFAERESTPAPSVGQSISVHMGASTSQSQVSASPLRPRVSFRTNGNFGSSVSGARSASVLTGGAARDMSLIHCPLCQRRVGLWSFATVSSEEEQADANLALSNGDSTSVFASAAKPTRTRPSKPFDLVKEHRSYCPYVVRSTAVPSLPLAASPTATTANDDSGLMEGWRAVLAIVQRHGLSERQRLARFTGNTGAAEQDRDEELKGVGAMVAGVKSKGVRVIFLLSG